MRRRWKWVVAIGVVAFAGTTFFILLSRDPHYQFIDDLNGVKHRNVGVTTVYEPGLGTYILGVQEYFFFVRPDTVSAKMESELTRKGWQEDGFGDYSKGADWIVFTQLSRQRAADLGVPDASCMVSIRRKPGWLIQQWHKVQLRLSPP